MKVSNEIAKAILFEDYLPEGFAIVETEPWEDDGKYSFGGAIFSYEDKFYSIGFTRSGSYHTDYYYCTENGDDYEAAEVEKKEVVTTKWVAVK